MHHQRKLLKKGAEADIFLADWYGKRAIAKVRVIKSYRHSSLDLDIRRRRTVHEAQMLSEVKPIGVVCPLVYFVDPISCEIVMEFVTAKNVDRIINSEISSQIGTYAGLLHSKNIIHGDLTTSNFLTEGKLYLLDFGLSFHSDRLEDKAVDIRLIKETFSSIHYPQFESLFSGFLQGYSKVQGNKTVKKLLTKVSSIERRARYALH